MTAGKKMIGIYVSYGARGGDVHVATNKNRAHCRTGDERIGLLLVASRTHAHNRNDSRRCELGGKLLHRIFSESTENERGVNRLQIIREVLRSARRQTRPGRLSGKGWNRLHLNGNACWCAINRADLEHLGDRSNPCDRLFRKFADTKRDCAREFPIEINGAAAHAGDYTGVLGFLTAETNENYVALGTIGVSENAEDLDVHRLWLRPLKNRVSHAAHSLVDLTNGDGLNGFRFLRVTLWGETQEGEYNSVHYHWHESSSSHFVPPGRPWGKSLY